MRLEATIPDTGAAQLEEVIAELKTTKSQIVDEALALFFKAFMEAKRGRCVAIIEPESRKIVTEIVSPSLSQVEWVAHRERAVLSEKDMKRVGELVAHPRAPKDTLRRALAKRVAAIADCMLVTDPISEGDAAADFDCGTPELNTFFASRLAERPAQDWEDLRPAP
jgi:hypothetical protein